MISGGWICLSSPFFMRASVIELPRSAKLTILIFPLFSHKIDRYRRHAKDSAVGHLSKQRKYHSAIFVLWL